ncbi:AAA family ATPase [Variovorax guangxiensis]|uniref:AAA family ATPase n=1 Tax=Variovorax guangxiensis TaxID=1775474 RepID=UPI0028652452|nr:AAA family ATPase [Variovorax guangxiensis]MDR6855760.1 putative ABC-type ATPase [Variovorax guangxiensis]
MPAAAVARPFIFVLAGVNGAGKSSVGGAMLAEHGLAWFNPDSFARELVAQLGLAVEEANARAWTHGRSQLEAAIANGTNYAFETTLGARTIPALLAEAAATHDVVMLFCGLRSPEMHIQRVRSRVASGGHDIPEDKIRERWVASRINLIRLMPQLARLQVFDNSTEADPGQDIPEPVLVLEMVEGRVTYPVPDDTEVLESIPEWARPIVQAAIERQVGSAA